MEADAEKPLDLRSSIQSYPSSYQASMVEHESLMAKPFSEGFTPYNCSRVSDTLLRSLRCRHSLGLHLRTAKLYEIQKDTCMQAEYWRRTEIVSLEKPQESSSADGVKSCLLIIVTPHHESSLSIASAHRQDRPQTFSGHSSPLETNRLKIIGSRTGFLMEPHLTE